MDKKCEHYDGIPEKISPHTEGCEECEKEGTDWVALRLCMSCGHVGCCDSSQGTHATNHFKKTGHPVMIALPNYAWKWCYVHKAYS
ncbi:MAG: UBP-type zinc finger domain-containing protein [Nitrosotalea sp.]